MSARRLEYHYLKLHRCYADTPVETTLQALAERLSCTRRHVRSLLGQMEAQGWIQWSSRAGRGYRSTLRCLCAPEQLLRQRVESLLSQGHIEQAMELMETEPQQLTPLLLKQLGKTQQQGEQILRVPYYRPMPNLNPGLPLRRSEVHLVRQIFNGLTRINEENGEVESDLAHHWQPLDELQWLFFLRPAVRFHDGHLLTVEDVLATLWRLQAQPLFAHLQAVSALDARTIRIELSCADPRLPWLLADVQAMVLPVDHASRADFSSRPVGTGPYRVVENNAYHLRLRAFDDYFALRALLDEVDIWMMPLLAEQLELGARQVCGLEIQQESSAPGVAEESAQESTAAAPEMVLEQGGYFLLCDSRSPWWQAPSARRWLQGVLNPYRLMNQVPLMIRRYWAPAASLLPHWLHQQAPGESLAPPELLASSEPRLRLAFYEQQPEYRLLAKEMCGLLAEQGITLELIELDYAAWQQGEIAADLWLGSVNFPAPAEWSLGCWLFGNPLLRRAIHGRDAAGVALWHQHWRAQQLSSEQLVDQVIRDGWLQPLFHHWLRLQGPAQARGIRLNNLGWFDFKSAWLAPEVPTGGEVMAVGGIG